MNDHKDIVIFVRNKLKIIGVVYVNSRGNISTLSLFDDRDGFGWLLGYVDKMPSLPVIIMFHRFLFGYFASLFGMQFVYTRREDVELFVCAFCGSMLLLMESRNVYSAH